MPPAWSCFLPIVFGLLTAAGVAEARDPEPLPEALSSYPLGSRLGPITQEPLFSSARLALQVVDVDTGDELFGWNADTALVPASVTKAVTSAVALRTLGTSWRFETTILHDGEISPEGVLEGNLYIRGDGDPTLVVEKMWKLLHDMRLRGIVEIDGDVYFDDSWAEDQPLIAGWNKKVDISDGPAYFAPIGALSINYNAVSLVVSPGLDVGSPAVVDLDTPSDAVEIENKLQTVSKSSRRSLVVEREVNEEDGHVKFTLSGRIPMESKPIYEYRAVGHPTVHYMGVVKDLLGQLQVRVRGRFKQGPTPEGALEVVSLASPPLCEILNHTNKYSSNFMAEQVLRAIGAEAHGLPATTANGVEAIRSYLDELGFDRADYNLVNGSGLTREGVLKPSEINAVLLDMAHDPALAPDYMASLAIGGVDGTLRRRFRSDPEEVGRVRGKTGSLDGVYCLAGYFFAPDGHTYAMTILANDLGRSSSARRIQDMLGAALMARDSGDPSGATDAAGPEVDE